MSDINEELITEHDIYISIGLKHPMKPSDCTKLIDSLLVENFTMDSWGTHTKDEWIDVVNECQEKVDSLKATIDSQKAEIEKYKSHAWKFLNSKIDTANAKHMLDTKNKKLQVEIESQKEEINRLIEQLQFYQDREGDK